MPTLIRGAYLLGLSNAAIGADGEGDVLIEEGRIVAIAPSLAAPAETEVVEANGQYLGPSLVDLYSHSGEPGHEARETYASIKQAAKAGGFSRVGLLPDTEPAIDSTSAIQTIQRASDKGGVQFLPWATVTLGGAGEQLCELAELAGAGALGFTDSAPITNFVLLRRLLEYAQPLQKPIALWPCNPDLAGDGSAREGVDALRLGLAGVSATAETTALATLLECVAQCHTPVHIMRVSTSRSVALIQQAKARGLPVTASVAWHHLIFDTQDLKSYDPNLRHEPPLGLPSDRAALIEGVANGILDAIAVDHSPYTYEENTVAFDAAPPGAIGLELALPILWQTLVEGEAQWQPQTLWRSLSYSPLRCLGLEPNTLKVDSPAELTLFDPRIEWQVSAKSLQSLSSNTHWLGQSIRGKVTATWMG